VKRRTKFIIAGVLAAVVILGAIGGIALADTGSSTGTAVNPLIAKVATILGIDQAKVQSAFDQAQKELQSETLDKWLSDQVTAGKITQAQADQYKAWLNSKPAGIDQLGRGPGMGKGFGGGFGRGCERIPPSTGSSATN
jgi:hypothetical protein